MRVWRWFPLCSALALFGAGPRSALVFFGAPLGQGLPTRPYPFALSTLRDGALFELDLALFFDELLRAERLHGRHPLE
jgi:hypothetical protein